MFIKDESGMRVRIASIDTYWPVDAKHIGIARTGLPRYKAVPDGLRSTLACEREVLQFATADACTAALTALDAHFNVLAPTGLKPVARKRNH